MHPPNKWLCSLYNNMISCRHQFISDVTGTPRMNIPNSNTISPIEWFKSSNTIKFSFDVSEEVNLKRTKNSDINPAKRLCVENEKTLQVDKFHYEQEGVKAVPNAKGTKGKIKIAFDGDSEIISMQAPYDAEYTITSGELKFYSSVKFGPQMTLDMMPKYKRNDTFRMKKGEFYTIINEQKVTAYCTYVIISESYETESDSDVMDIYT